jgi:hypothetical protein
MHLIKNTQECEIIHRPQFWTDLGLANIVMKRSAIKWLNYTLREFEKQTLLVWWKFPAGVDIEPRLMKNVVFTLGNYDWDF